MKKRRTLIIALMLVVAVALGVAYANTTGHLIINGTVSTQQQTFEVKFTDYATASSTNAKITGTPGTLPDKTTSFTVNGMSKDGDSITGTFTITNYNEFPMYLTGIKVDNLDTNVFDVTTSLDGMTETVELAAYDADTRTGGTTTVDVTITLKQGMSDNIKQFFTLTINSSSIDALEAPSETTPAGGAEG